MALPIKWSLPSLSEITSPSAGSPNTLSTSLENTQSCPCKIRARGLTTIPAIEGIQRPIPHSPSQRFRASTRELSTPNCHSEPRRERSGLGSRNIDGKAEGERAVSESNLSFSQSRIIQRCLDFARHDKTASELKIGR